MNSQHEETRKVFFSCYTISVTGKYEKADGIILKMQILLTFYLKRGFIIEITCFSHIFSKEWKKYALRIHSNDLKLKRKWTRISSSLYKGLKSTYAVLFD